MGILEQEKSPIHIFKQCLKDYKDKDIQPSNEYLLELFDKVEDQVLNMAKLLLESRDALPGIPLTKAKLMNLDLKLAERIEEALEPWVTTEDDADGQ